VRLSKENNYLGEEEEWHHQLGVICSKLQTATISQRTPKQVTHRYSAHTHTHLHPPAGNRVEWNEREWNGMAEQSVSI